MNYGSFICEKSYTLNIDLLIKKFKLFENILLVIDSLKKFIKIWDNLKNII